MSSAQQTIRPTGRIILHHLSDLHYEDTPEGKKKDILVKYKGYLEKLPVERRPDVIVITGDLTATGTKADIKTVATILHTCFPTWATRLHEHVFIVPGPRDINWEGTTSPGLETFFETFSEFALPTRESASSEPAVLDTGAAAFIAYPIDTCYSPDDLQAKLKSEFTEYASRYEAFVKRRDILSKQGRSLWGRLKRVCARGGEMTRAAELNALRKQFLELTEGAQPVALDSGRITLNDIARFQQWADASAVTRPAPTTPLDSTTAQDPLKILITHHPLAIQPEQDTSDDTSQVALRSFQKIAKTARASGFHLALHGHIHKPQVLSDLSILEGQDVQHPIRQIGAASLGDTGLFNEITAQYRAEEGQGIWRLELRLVDVTADDPAATSSFVLLNPAQTADNKVEQLTREKNQRMEFERRMRIAMRRYSEVVYQTQNENRPEKLSGFALPQDTMQFIEGIIRDVIFDGFHVRVRLLLKSVETYRPLPTLTPKYLTPAVLEGPEPLVYPASVAAWSLVLGRTLIYPQLNDTNTDSDDHDWLRRSEKIPDLLKALELLTQDEFAKSYSESEAVKRYQTLHSNLTTISANGESTITGQSMYQTAPGDSPGNFPSFICVPYPRRSSGGALPGIPEVAALDIGVRPLAQPGGQRSSEVAEENPFTLERIDMLECLTELIGMVLTTSSALGKPRGMWDDRTRA